MLYRQTALTLDGCKRAELRTQCFFFSQLVDFSLCKKSSGSRPCGHAQSLNEDRGPRVVESSQQGVISITSYEKCL